MKRRALGIILLVLGIVIGALGALPTGWFGRLYGVGDPSYNPTADSIVGIGVLLLAVGLSLLLWRGGRGGWTGFAGKTAWDWLQLLIIPVVIAGFAAWFNLTQTQISIQASQSQHDTDVQLATDQQQESVLVTFESDISDLLLRDNLRSSTTGDAVRDVARARTLVALRRLDPIRKGYLIQFLHEAQLVKAGGANNPIVYLAGADLEDAFLSGADLTSADLSGADLSYAGLGLGVEYGPHRTRVQIGAANLTGAVLIQARLTQAFLIGTNLTRADLSGADLTGAVLDDADLTGANLTGAVVSSQQLAQARSLQGATLPDGSKHP
jgi:uncharacterized protein YjbI with pentapeptide repeats